MKKILNKHSKISKIIALWLVFIMMATPFFSHSGLLSNPRAEGGTPVGSSQPKIILGSFNFEESDIEVAGNSIYIKNADSTIKEHSVPSYSII